MKPTNAEAAIVARLLREAGTEPKVITSLLRLGPTPGKMEAFGTKNYILYRAYDSACILDGYRLNRMGGLEPDPYAVSHNACRSMTGLNIEWPKLIIIFFSDPEWTELQFSKFGSCVEIGDRHR